MEKLCGNLNEGNAISFAPQRPRSIKLSGAFELFYFGAT